MEFTFTFFSIMIAACAGFYFGRNFSNSNQEKNRLESELKDKQEELDAFRNKVSGHFEKTASLFNQVSDSYQSLYDHMAKSSNQLCASQTFQLLPQSLDSALDEKPNPAHKTNTDSKNMFDANKLYNAHDYRNQEEQEEADNVQLNHNPKIIDIESAKEDRNEPALDYAVKADGVVNHNSLNDDEIKKNQS